MARTIKEIKDELGERFVESKAVCDLYGITDRKTFGELFPAVSVEGVLLYVFAFGMWVIESLFDRHRAEVEDALDRLKPHSIRWYIEKAKAYQWQDQLPTDGAGQVISDEYAVPDEKKRIVRYAVAQEDAGVLRLKVAKYCSETNHSPHRLRPVELAGLKRYFNQIKDAGIVIQAISNNPDSMRVDMTLYYNPMKLRPDGSDGDRSLFDAQGNDVVRRAIESVIENLPFNGVCRKTDIIDAVKSLEGIDAVDLRSVRTCFKEEKPDTAVHYAESDYTEIDGYKVPESGYFRLDALNLTLKTYNHEDDAR